MFFFVAVLILWGSTATMASWSSWVLPPVVDWAWWTFHLYVCGIAALSESFTTLQARLMGLFGYTLLVVYYTTQHETFMEFLPESADHPALWASVFLTVNLLGPVLLVTVGCLGAAVQQRRG